LIPVGGRVPRTHPTRYGLCWCGSRRGGRRRDM